MTALLKEAEKVVDVWLGLAGREIGRSPQFQHRAALLELSQSGFSFGSKNLVDQLLRVVRDNSRNGNPGAVNCEFRRVSPLNSSSTSPEVTLERSLIHSAIESERTDLGNMMPVASGVFGVQADARAAVDLVQRQRNCLSLIELKIESNTPLSAAMQILWYGLCYVAARFKPDCFGCQSDQDAFSASTIELNVLAPEGYFTSYPPNVLEWLRNLSDRVNQDLKTASLPIREGDSGYSLTFQFKHFPKEFLWEATYANDPGERERALGAFDNRAEL